MSEWTPGHPDHAVAAVLGARIPPRCRIAVDLSHTENSARRAVDYADCDYTPAIGEVVDAVDLIDGRAATAEVVGLDERQRIVRIAIDWTTIRQATA